MVLPLSIESSRRGRRTAAHGLANTVLLVVAEPTLRELLAADLLRAGMQPLPVVDAAHAQRLLEHVMPDAVVVDLDDVADVQGAWDWVPPGPKRVLLSRDPSCRRSDCGADLCLLKPVQPRALVLDIARLLRPVRPTTGSRSRPPLLLGGLEIDRGTPSIRVLQAGVQGAAGLQVDLPETEHRLLVALAEASPRNVTREHLRLAVWGDDSVSLRSVDQYVRRLRARLEPLVGRELVHTVRSFGYRLESAPASGP
jgi:two-component system phosphate regulon response regulator PhoB